MQFETSTAEKIAVKPEEDWTAGLPRSDRGALKPSFATACAILRWSPEYKGKLRYNEMTLQPEIAGKSAEEEGGHLRETVERRFGLSFAPEVIGTAVLTVAKETKYHPVREYLESLAWDGTQRLVNVAEKVLGSTDPMACVVVSKWFLAAVARALRPGSKVDTALILVGDQGLMKSSFFEVLGGAYFAATPLDLATPREAALALRAAWIYELAEIDGITSRKHADQVKRFLSVSTDTFRAPYARAPKAYARECVFGGTTNKTDYLTDPTGERRFWTVEVDRPVDLALLREWRDQLWAEAVHYWLEGEQWHLTPEEEKALAQGSRYHRECDLWEETIETWLRSPESPAEPTSAQILSGAIGLPRADHRREHEIRVGKVMHALGWRTCQKRVGNDRRRVYSKVLPQTPVPPLTQSEPDTSGCHNSPLVTIAPSPIVTPNDEEISSLSQLSQSSQSNSQNLPETAPGEFYPKPIVPIVPIVTTSKKPGDSLSQYLSQYPEGYCDKPPLETDSAKEDQDQLPPPDWEGGEL